jgi:hypothetical protein
VIFETVTWLGQGTIEAAASYIVFSLDTLRFITMVTDTKRRQGCEFACVYQETRMR